MRFLGNIIWLILGGLVTSILWFLLGIILCITIIGIPFGRQCFKFAHLNFFPFGNDVKTNFDSHPIMNIIWIILFGWEFSLSYLISGILCCITIVGIPFGLQSFKFMKLALIPFGAKIEKI